MADQSQVVNWLTGLIPQINESRDAEGTLLKFAKKRNLAEAQLQKLGHVFNTAKTLSYLDKNPDNRGGTFNVLDVDTMLEKYASPSIAKSASTVTEVKEVVMERMSDLFPSKLMDDETLEPSYDMNNSHIVKAAYTKRSYSKVNRDNMEQLVFDLEQGIKKDIQKLAVALRQDPEIDFESTHADIWFVKGASVAKTVEDIAGYLNRIHHVSVKTAQDAGKQRLVNPKHASIYDGLLDIHEKRLSLKAAQAVLEEEFQIEEPVSYSEGEDAFDKIALKKKSLEKTAGPVAEAFGFGPGAKTTTKKKKERTTTKTIRDQQGNVIEVEEVFLPGEEETTTVSETSGGSASDSVQSMRDDAKSLVEAIKSPFESAKRPETVLPVAPGLGYFIPDNTGKQKEKQKAIDKAYDEVKQEAVFHELMVNDPILSNLSSEEETVVEEAYATIAKIAPNISSDKTAIRPILRQVTEFGGITPLEMKNILEMEKEYIKVQGLSEEQDEKKYRIKAKDVARRSIQL
jgi:hypothetical protein